MRTVPVLFAFLASACTQTGVFQGRVVDGLTNKPVSGVGLAAKAPAASNIDCQVAQATSGPDGTYQFDKICVGEKYTLTAAEGTTQHLSDLPGVTVQAGQPTKAMGDIKAWSLPADVGMYVFSNGTYTAMRANADVRRAFLWESQDTVRAPTTLPKTEPRVDSGDWLVMMGDRYLERVKFFPLIKSDVRKFDKKGDEETAAAWWYVGMEFTSDTDYKRVEATPDPAKVVNLTVGENKIRFIRGDAVPAGHYAALADMDRRMTVVTFGPDAKPLADQ